MISLLFVLYIIFSITAVFLFKSATVVTNVSFKFNILGICITPLSIVGIGLYGMSFLIWMYLIQKSNISVLVPMALGISTVVNVLLATIILKENVSMLQWAGVIMITIGIFIVNVK